MPLPRRRSQNCGQRTHGLGIGRRGGNDLQQAHVARRIEEMRAEPVPLKFLGKPSAIFATGRPLVLVVTIVPGRRTWATLLSNSRLISRSSTTASMIQSQSASQPRWSSKLPTVTSRASDGFEEGGRLRPGGRFPVRRRPGGCVRQLRIAVAAVRQEQPCPGARNGFRHWPGERLSGSPWFRRRVRLLFQSSCALCVDLCRTAGCAVGEPLLRQPARRQLTRI